jgi:phage minor structural protein
MSNKNLYYFNDKYELQFTLSNEKEGACPYEEADHIEGLDWLHDLEFKAPANNIEAQQLANGGYVGIFDQDNNFQLFEIYLIEEEDSASGLQRAIFAQHVFNETDKLPVYDKRPTNTTAAAAMDSLLEGQAKWKRGQVADLGLGSTNFYHESIRSGAKKIQETWGGELRTRITFDGNKITGFYIDLLTRRGSDTGKRITIEKDAESIKRKVDRSNIYTAVVPRGKGEQTENGGYSRRLSIADVVWSTAAGDPADKPAGQVFIGDEAARLAYGIPDGNGGMLHRFLFVEFDETEDSSLLINQGWETLQQNNKPLVSYETKIINLEAQGLTHEAVRLGDTNFILDDNFAPPLQTEARIIKLKRRIDDETQTEPTLGNFMPMFSDQGKEIEELKKVVGGRAGIWDKVEDPINETDFPNEQPEQPGNVIATGSFKKVIVEWDYNPALYISYEVYGSQVPGFVVDPSNLLWKGKANVFAHEADVNQQWYYRVRAINTHGTAGPLSPEVSATTARIITDDILFGAVNAEKLADLAVTAGKLADLAVTGGKLADGAVINSKLAAAAVEANALAAGAVTNPKLGPLAVDAAKLAEGAVLEGKLGDLAVTAAKLAADSVTNEKIGPAAVNTTELANLAVATGKLAALAVDATKLADGSATNAKIGDLAISNGKLAALAVDAAKLADGAATAAKIADNAITNAKLADLAVSATELADSAVTATKIANLAVGTAAIANTAITNAKIGLLAVDTAQLAAAAVESAKIANLAVGTAALADAAITNAKIGSLAVSTAQLQDALITSAKIGSLAVGTAAIADSAITNAKITNLAVTGAKIANLTVGSGQIADLAVTNAKLANLAVGSAEIADAAITSAKIASLAVGTGAIANAAITEAKIASLAVGTAAIKDAAITNAKIDTLSAEKIIVSGGITHSGNVLAGLTSSGTTASAVATDGAKDIGSPYLSFGGGNSTDTAAEGSYIQYDLGGVFRLQESRIYFYSGETGRFYWYKIKYSIDGVNWFYAVGTDATNGWKKSIPRGNAGTSITNPTIDQFAIPIVARYVRLYANGNSVNTTNHIYEWEFFSSNQTFIHGDSILTNTVTATQMLAGTITAASGIIANAAIESAQIANLAVGNAAIANAAITNAKIGSLAVSNGQIQDAAITNAKIANLAVDAAKIANLAVTGAKIADATITSAKISSIDAGKITTGTLSAITISGVTINGSTFIAENTNNKVTITGDIIEQASKRFNYSAKMQDGWLQVIAGSQSTYVTDRGLWQPNVGFYHETRGYDVQGPLQDRGTESFWSVKAFGAGHGRWLKLAQINNTTDLGASEQTSFIGTVYVQADYGNTANTNIGAIHFNFGVRGGVIKPVISYAGGRQLGIGTSAPAFQIRKDAYGDYYLYFYQPYYSRMCTFIYFNPGGVTYMFAENPTGTTVWDSATGDVQVTRFGHDVMVNSDGGQARWQANDSNYIYMNKDTGRTYFYMGAQIKHTLNENGTKSGGSIEIDGENLGMSPIDSPRVLLSDIITDIELSDIGTRVELEPRFAKALERFSVWPNNPTAQILEKGQDYFIVKGSGICDFNIVGVRIGEDGKYFDDMDIKNELVQAEQNGEVI